MLDGGAPSSSAAFFRDFSSYIDCKSQEQNSGAHTLVLWNKSDLAPLPGLQDRPAILASVPWLPISCTNGTGTNELLRTIADCVATMYPPLTHKSLFRNSAHIKFTAFIGTLDAVQ